MKTLDLILCMAFAYFYVWTGLATVTWSIYHIWDFFGKGTGDGADNSIDSDCILYRHVYKWDSQLFGMFLYRCGRKIRRTESVGRWLYRRLHGRS